MVRQHLRNTLAFQNINEPHLFALVTNNHSTVSTWCINGCIGSNQIITGWSHVDQSVVKHVVIAAKYSPNFGRTVVGWTSGQSQEGNWREVAALWEGIKHLSVTPDEPVSNDQRISVHSFCWCVRDGSATKHRVSTEFKERNHGYVCLSASCGELGYTCTVCPT